MKLDLQVKVRTLESRAHHCELETHQHSKTLLMGFVVISTNAVFETVA